MRLLHIIGSLDPSTGGPCQVIRSLVPELEQLGMYSHVVSLDRPGAHFINKDAFKVFALGPGKTSWHFCVKLLPWLVSNLSKYDSVIVHGLWLYHSFAVRRAVQHLRKVKRQKHNVDYEMPKVFIMPHGMLDPYFQRAPERKFKALRNAVFWTLVEGKAVNEANGLLFTCEEELALARETFQSYKPQKEICVSLGVAEPPPYAAQLQDAFLRICPEVEQQRYILYLGRIHQKKGVDLLLQAYARLAYERADLQLPSSDSDKASLEKGYVLPKLVIAGPGAESPYGLKVRRFVSENQILEGSVFFTGMLTGDAKWGALYGCQAFVLPSHQENFGIAVVEALACNKPVLISRKVNIWREVSEAGGAMVADDTLAGTIELLTTWIRLSQGCKLEMGQNARKVYENVFALKMVAKALRDVVLT